MACPDMPNPLCLVENTGDRLTVNSKTLEVISKITSPVAVVAIAGPYRTGKSYLLNRLMDKNKGFALGSAIQSKTKGIWVWCRPHPRNPKHCLLLLDTEGLGDVEKGSSKNDSHIFALAILLSSMLVYNNKATLQNDALEQLHFVSELTDLIHVRASTKEEEGTEFVKFFPDFVWAIRDFTLELVIGDQSVTPDEYLDHALVLKKGHGAKVAAYNTPRECLRTFFRSLKCFVFDRPVQDTKKFKVLENLQEHELDPEFLQEANAFCQYVFSKSAVKTYEGKSLNGSSFGCILQMYVQTIQSGKVPCLENAYTAMAEIENQKAVTEALEIYAEARQFLSLPTDTVQELSDVIRKCEQRALEHFMKTAFDDKENAYQYVLKEKMKEAYNQLLAENESASSDTCQKLFQSLGAQLEKKLSAGAYLKPGGFKEYSADKLQVVKKFNASPRRGVMAQEALQIYLKKKEAEGSSILQGDKEMSKKQKDIAAEREAAEQNEQRAHAAEEKKARMEQKILDDRKSNKEHLEQIEKKMKEESAQLKREHDAVIRKKMEEQEKFMREGHRERADAMSAEIKAIEQQMQEDEDKSKGGNDFMDVLTGTVETAAPFAGPYYGTAIYFGTQLVKFVWKKCKT